MSRLFYVAATLILVTLSVTVDAQPTVPGSPKISPSPTVSSALSAIPAAGAMSFKPSGLSFSDWSSKDVSSAHARLQNYISTTATIPVPDQADAIDDLLDDKKVPKSVYTVARDARELFKRDAIPSVSQLGNELPSEIAKELGKPFAVEVQKYNEQIKKALSKSRTSSLTGPIKINGIDLPPEAIDIIRRLVERIANGSLQDLLMRALGAQLAIRIVRMLTPIAYAALKMLVSDLRHAVDLIMESILDGVERSVWLQKLRDLVVKDLRENTLAMLVEIKTSLSAHLGDVLISAVAMACQIGEAGYTIIRGLFGSLIDKYVALVVGKQIDRLSAHLRKLWNMPELKSVVTTLVNAAERMHTPPGIAAPVAIKRRDLAIAA